MTGTTPFRGLYVPSVGADRDVWGTLTNLNWTAIDSLLFGFTTISVAGSGNYTASASEGSYANITLTGTLTGGRNFILPAVCGNWHIKNQTTGSFALTIACAGGGNTIEIKQGATTELWSDGTNICPATGASTGRLMSNGNATAAWECVVQNQFQAVYGTSGWALLPVPLGQTKGIMLNWGVQAFPVGGPAPYTQTFMQPYSSAPTVLLGGITSSSYYTSAITTTNFLLHSGTFSSTSQVAWLSIGPQA